MRERQVIDVFHPVIYDDAIQAAADTLRSGWIGMGSRVMDFEKKFSAYAGARHCVAVNTGTSALHLAFKSLGLPPGSKVLTGEISHLATITAIIHAGYTPVFADVERRTGNISVESARAAMTDNIRAIACTHIGGYPCDLDGLRELTGSRGIPLVEDCSHAIGAEYHGDRIGNGTLCCFSFGFPKAITGVEGGAVLTREPEYAEKIRALRNFGMRDDVKFTEASMVPVIEEPGYRYIWNDVMASIALRQMDHLEADNRRRKEIAKRYVEELKDTPGVYIPAYNEDRTSSCFFIPLFFERRDDLSKKLDTLGIRTKIYFRGYSEYYGNGTRFPDASWYGRHELTLPINVHMSDEDLGSIVTAIREGW